MTRSIPWLFGLFSLFIACPALAAEAMEIHLDASDAPRKRLQAHLVIPVRPGPLKLYYPKWIAGEHSPSGPVTDLTGIKIQADGKPLVWKRDDEDTFAINLTVPEATAKIEVDVEFIATASKEGFSGSASITPRLAVLYWNHVLLYPKGSVMQETKIVPSLTLPTGWKMGCALPVKSERDGRIQFEPTTLEHLCDSPIACGKHYREVAIGPKDGPPHYLCIVADSAEALAISPSWKAGYDKLVIEAHALFGARHYRGYRFLLTLSDHVGHFGLEHHESSDNRCPERMFLDSSYHKTWHAWLLSHEYVHSWNGKYRRPSGMVLSDFQQPMRTKLLWVYEGLTQYLGLVLAVRSGLWTPELSRDHFARVGDWAKNQTGRDWRSLEDTAATAQQLYYARQDGQSRRRGVDFYDEGSLIWLDADTLIREKTRGEKSLDDFCRAFFGGKDGLPVVKPYDFEDIVKTLNGIVEHNWREFFEKRVMTAGASAPLDGLQRGGWKLSFGDSRTDGYEATDSDNGNIDLTSSLGLIMRTDGTIVDVIPLKAADKAGLASGMKLLAVNGRRWTHEHLRNAIAQTKDSKGKLEFLLENSDFYETIKVPYAEGEKYPRLEQVSQGNDLLGEILRPRLTK